ncbi:MAG: sulfotransferase domain-containing protein [Thermoplasmatales archaeon]|nr:sulfotransferase domain-containing protein [Thermoplasmatales archaeon]MCK5261559.1 sulfotransferase domain-containing protein [Thermoplasmatales archaeon]
MKLNENINYIVSGLERSGTSMVMQILLAGGAPVAFDNSRLTDQNNPKGYYELEGGKIINRLIDGTFPLNEYKGKLIKITSYGIKYLPPGNYKIIYSERNIEEILDSMEKMANIKDTNREETRESFIKLNSMIKNYIRDREDVEVLLVNYNNILSDPSTNIKKIYDFLGLADINLEKMIDTVDKKLYRQRRSLKKNIK